MSRNFIVKKCKNCGEVVKVMGENDFEIECCGEKMGIDYIVVKNDITKRGYDMKFEEIYNEDGLYIFKPIY